MPVSPQAVLPGTVRFLSLTVNTISGRDRSQTIEQRRSNDDNVRRKPELDCLYCGSVDVEWRHAIVGSDGVLYE